jgi:hypothetical protein
MSNDGNSRDSGGEESTYSGELGERNRNTPGRTPRELGLDPEEMRGHGVVGQIPGEESGDLDLTGMRETDGERRDRSNADEGRA